MCAGQDNKKEIRMMNKFADFFTGNRRELSEEELAGVAGGLTDIEKENCVIWRVPCSICGKQIECYLPCHDGKLDMHTSKVEARYWVDEHVMEHLAQTGQYDRDISMEFLGYVKDILREHESDLAEFVAAHS